MSIKCKAKCLPGDCNRSKIRQNIPSAHVLAPSFRDNDIMELPIVEGRRIDHVCFDNFKRLGDQGSNGSSEASFNQGKREVFLSCYYFGHLRNDYIAIQIQKSQENYMLSWKVISKIYKNKPFRLYLIYLLLFDCSKIFCLCEIKICKYLRLTYWLTGQIILVLFFFISAVLQILNSMNHIQSPQRKFKHAKKQTKNKSTTSLGSTYGTSSANISKNGTSFGKLAVKEDQYQKNKGKNSYLVAISNANIQEQVSKEINLASKLLKQVQLGLKTNDSLNQHRQKSEEQDIFNLDDIIKHKDNEIKQLTLEITRLKSHEDHNSNTANQQIDHKFQMQHQKQKLFKLAEQVRNDREELAKCFAEHSEKFKNYLRIKKMIEGIEQKFHSNGLGGLTKQINGHHNKEGKQSKLEHLHIEKIITFEQFKQKMKDKKKQDHYKSKKIDFYHFNPLDKPTANKNMKDLMNRKNITLAALKNSRKKHQVEMSELDAKLQFLKDQDLLLNQKIMEKQKELKNADRKFSESNKKESPIIRNTLAARFQN